MDWLVLANSIQIYQLIIQINRRYDFVYHIILSYVILSCKIPDTSTVKTISLFLLNIIFFCILIYNIPKDPFISRKMRQPRKN